MASVIDQRRATRAPGTKAATLRRDNWWVEPLITVAVLGGFVIYATWAAFVNKN